MSDHLVCGMKWPFDLYEDYDGCYHIIDATTRIVLSDEFAYDIALGHPDKEAQKKAAHDRMMEIVRALNRQLGPILVDRLCRECRAAHVREMGEK